MTQRFLDERDRRWQELNDAMTRDDIDALIFAANDYRGHKGSLRWVADYNLPHKSGTAVMFRGEEPILVLEGSLRASRKPTTRWVSDFRFPGVLADGLAEVIAERPVSRVGVVGLGQVLKVDQYLALTKCHPNVEFTDYSAEFDAIRAVKSPLEQQGAEESAHILDQCFSRLLEITRPGMTERDVAAEMYRVGLDLGGEDPLFLTMYTDHFDDEANATFGIPGDRILHPHSLFTFSFEIIGPLGYWTELSRMVTFAPPKKDDKRMARAVARGIQAGADGLKVGATPADVQRGIDKALEDERVTQSYWSGHSLGLDVLENPWIGLDAVEDGEQNIELPIKSGYVMTLHPQVQDKAAQTSGYMSDTFIVSEEGARKLSAHPTGLYQLSNGEVTIHEAQI